MSDAKKLLDKWKHQSPRDSVDAEDALAVMHELGMHVREGAKHHMVATHPALKGSDAFPFGSITINFHAFGKQGQAHPKGIKDILKAAKIIQEAQEKEAQGEDTDE